MAVQGIRCSAAGWAVAYLIVLVSAAIAGVQAASVDHTVGGATNGWNKPTGNTLTVTYLQDWANTQSFAQGDRLIFEYNPGAHNVLVVSLADYVICNTLSPIAKYTSGKDSVIIPGGLSYYMCGVPTHCESGQKFNITAASSASKSSSSIVVVPVVAIVQAFIVAVVVVATLILW